MNRNRLFSRQLLFGLAGLACLLALWELGHRIYGSFVLPSLAETLNALIALALSGKVTSALAATAVHACLGWIAGVLIGLLIGSIAGMRDTARFFVQPLSIIFLSVPAIAWIVLSLLWFGGGAAVVFTVMITVSPIVFTATVEGFDHLDLNLLQMTRLFKVSLGALIEDVYFPYIFGYVHPALATTLGLSWKVAIMAELFTGASGIGDGLAGARARLDTAQTMAWIVVLVAMAFLLDQLILKRIQRRFFAWRREEENQPHG